MRRPRQVCCSGAAELYLQALFAAQILELTILYLAKISLIIVFMHLMSFNPGAIARSVLAGIIISVKGGGFVRISFLL